MKTAIGIPSIGDIPGECFSSHIIACLQASKHGEIVLITPRNVMPHSRARELIITEALWSGCDYLWFIDADTSAPKDAFNKLLDALQDEDVAMSSGYYVMRGYPFVTTWCKERLDTGSVEKLQLVGPCDKVVNIDGCGLGCALIDLKWIRGHLKEPFFQMTPDETLPTGFLWEDAFFCKSIKDVSGIVKGVADVVCTHYGDREAYTPESADDYRKLYLWKKELENAS